MNVICWKHGQAHHDWYFCPCACHEEMREEEKRGAREEHESMRAAEEG